MRKLFYGAMALGCAYLCLISESWTALVAVILGVMFIVCSYRGRVIGFSPVKLRKGPDDYKAYQALATDSKKYLAFGVLSSIALTALLFAYVLNGGEAEAPVAAALLIVVLASCVFEGCLRFIETQLELKRRGH
jgi:hypothetical protein